MHFTIKQCIKEKHSLAVFMGIQKSNIPQTRTGFACHQAILKKTDHIASCIGWSRNALIVASIMHIIRMIEDKSYNFVPDVVLQARAVIHGDQIRLKFPPEIKIEE